MIPNDNPITQDTEFVEDATGEIFTVLSGTHDGEAVNSTVLFVLGTEVPAVVYYSTSNVTRTIIVAETVFRQNFTAVSDV